MQGQPSAYTSPSSEVIRDLNDTEDSKGPSNSDSAQEVQVDPFSRRATHPRISSLRLGSQARTARGIPGITPPFQPAAPSLYRPCDPEEPDKPWPISLSFDPSPLRQLAFSNYSIGGRQRMPHAVSMAHSGFQAIILCGPGIGLSTFTSVPAEYPKALVEIANRPMVWYVLEWCYRMGVTDITLITPPSSKDSLGAALAQNPHLTSLPSPSPNLLAPADLEHTTPTAELLRLPEVQKLIKRDFLLLPCDLVCHIPGETFIETYLTSLAGLGGIGLASDTGYGASKSEINFLGGERSGRRGGLSIWYNTANREESVKKEECDFMCTSKLDTQNCPQVPAKLATKDIGLVRKLVWAMPMSELYDQIEEDKDKSWKIRQSLLTKHGSIKVLTQYRDAHIYLFPHWIKDFARLNEDFESVSEDLVGTLAKAEWRSPSYRSRFNLQKIFSTKSDRVEDQRPRGEIPIEEEVDLLSLSSTQTSLPAPPPQSTHHTTPLLLSVSLLLAKIPSTEEGSSAISTSTSKSGSLQYAHAQKIASTATVAPRVTISRSDSLIGPNSTIATQCVVKNRSVVMDGSTIGDKCVLTGTVVGKKVKLGAKCVLTGCEVQDGNVLSEGVEGKGEIHLSIYSSHMNNSALFLIPPPLPTPAATLGQHPARFQTHAPIDALEHIVHG
ncbi:hypothetical protein DV736_g4255, partial [Chaetothyriales sp. CBS 134916]